MTQDCRSLRKGNITITPKEVKISKHGILFLTADGTSDELEEDRILLACIENDGEAHRRPGVEEISPGTTGRLYLGTIYGTRCEIRTQELGETAGEVLMELVRHYPWLWVGSHACLDSGNPEEWRELREMVEQMRACSIRFG